MMTVKMLWQQPDNDSAYARLWKPQPLLSEKRSRNFMPANCGDTAWQSWQHPPRLPSSLATRCKSKWESKARTKPANSPLPVPIVLELPIIEQPVTPSPQAGYALLRANTLTDGDNTRHWVECARFAWTPEATRVEMVCAEDLRAEIVRRRAIFQWRDTARPNRAVCQAIQKITLMGSTHFPWTSR